MFFQSSLYTFKNQVIQDTTCDLLAFSDIKQDINLNPSDIPTIW